MNVDSIGVLHSIYGYYLSQVTPKGMYELLSCVELAISVHREEEYDNRLVIWNCPYLFSEVQF